MRRSRTGRRGRAAAAAALVAALALLPGPASAFSGFRESKLGRAREQQLPSVQCTQDGACVAAFIRISNGGRRDVGVQRSDDSGRTWKFPDILARDQEITDPPDVSCVELGASGAACVVIWDGGRDIGVFSARTLDGGETWTEPVVVEALEHQGPTRPPVVSCFLPAGVVDPVAEFQCIAAMFATDRDTRDTRRIIGRSTDGALSWPNRIDFVSDSFEGRDADVDCNAAGTLCVVGYEALNDPTDENDLSRRFFSITSTDGGISWSEPLIQQPSTEALIQSSLFKSQGQPGLISVERPRVQCISATTCLAVFESQVDGLSWIESTNTTDGAVNWSLSRVVFADVLALTNPSLACDSTQFCTVSWTAADNAKVPGFATTTDLGQSYTISRVTNLPLDEATAAFDETSVACIGNTQNCVMMFTTTGIKPSDERATDVSVIGRSLFGDFEGEGDEDDDYNEVYLSEDLDDRNDDDNDDDDDDDDLNLQQILIASATGVAVLLLVGAAIQQRKRMWNAAPPGLDQGPSMASDSPLGPNATPLGAALGPSRAPLQQNPALTQITDAEARKMNASLRRQAESVDVTFHFTWPRLSNIFSRESRRGRQSTITAV